MNEPEMHAEIERLRAEVVRTNDRFARARRRNGELLVEIDRVRVGWESAEARLSAIREVLGATP